MCLGLFLGSLFCMSVLVPVPHCFDDCGFVILPEVWDSYASCLVFVPQDAGGGVEKREPSCTVGGNVSWYNHYGEQYGATLENYA